MLGSAVICQVAAGRKNRLHLELSGTTSSLAFDQEQPELLWHGRAEGNLTRFRDPDTLSKSAARYALLPAGHAQGYQDCFDAFVADTYETITTGEAPDGLPDVRRRAPCRCADPHRARSRQPPTDAGSR